MNHFELDVSHAGSLGTTGIDEAGRGCLAGPVVIAAVSWNVTQVSQKDWFSSLDDSKKLTASVRSDLYQHIIASANRVRVAVLSNVVLDYLNILRATLHGFELVAPAYHPEIPLFIDGNQKPPSLGWAKTVVKGDSKLSSVAAAGVIAKVTRDGLMVQLAQKIPQYGLQGHKGYATASHRKAIAEHGPSCWHRKSFAPVRDLCQEDSEHDQLTLMELASSTRDQLVSVWERFQNQYQLYSQAGARKIIDVFQARGLTLIPTVHESRPSVDFPPTV